MKTFNLKTLTAIAALGLVLPALTYADHIHAKYNTAKPAACVIQYKYYDGDKNRVTCEYTDRVARPASNDWVNFGDSGCEVRHVDNSESQIYVIPQSYNNCFNKVSGSQAVVGVNVGAVGAVKTAGKDQSSDAKSFIGKESLTDGRAVKDYLDGAVAQDRFSKLDLQNMSKDGVNLRIMLNKTTSGDLGGFHYVYFLLQ